MFHLPRTKIYRRSIENFDFLDKNVIEEKDYFSAKDRSTILKYSPTHGNIIEKFFFIELLTNQRILINTFKSDFTTYIRKDKLVFLREQCLSLLLKKS